MRHTRHRKVLALCTATALIVPFYGCENAVAPADAPPAVSTFDLDPSLQPAVVDGRLAFRDTDHAEAYMKQIADAGTAELVKAEGQLQGFTSLRAYLDPDQWTEETTKGHEDSDQPTGNEAAALQKDSVVRSDFPVSDALLSTLNQRGEVQFGTTVFKLTRDNVYEVASADVAALGQVPTLSSPAPGQPDPRMTVRKVESTEILEPIRTSAAPSRIGGAPRASRASTMLGDCNVYAPGGWHRMHGRTSITNIWFYSEARVTTEWQNRHNFLWWSWWSNGWQSGTLAHDYWGNLYYGLWGGPLFGPVPVSGSQSWTGTSGITRNVMWMFGFGVRITGSLNARHSVSNWMVGGTCGT